MPRNNSELRKLVDNANTPIFGIDIHGNVNEWNRKTAEITGFEHSEAIHKPFVSTFIVPKLRQSVQQVLDRALTGDETSNYQLEFQTKSGETRYLLVNASTRRNATNNTIVGVVGVAQDVTETSKDDRAVAALARELRQFIDKANAPIFGIDVHGNVNEWNDKTAEITGFTKMEAENRPLVSTFIVPKLRQSVQDVLDKALQGHETSNYELEFRTKSNEIRHLLVNATTRRDAEHNIVGVVGVAQDVTEAVQRDAAVRAMARELRKLIDRANAPIFGIDVNGNVNEWNDKTAEITGFSKHEAMGVPLVATYIVPKLRNNVQDILDNALKGDETSNYELEFRTKSNETRYLLVNATTRRDANNQVVGVVGVAQDVTEAAKHDRAVASMAQALRQLVDTANAPIFGIDVHGNVNEWNDKTAEITGFSKEEAIQKPLVSTFIVPSLRQSVQNVLDKALKGDETSNYQLEFRTKTNEIRYLLVNATTRRDTDSNIIGVVGVAQDVTDDRKHSDELRQMQYIQASQEAKLETERNMTAYFAHELRNPLHAIDSALKLMSTQLSTEESTELVNSMTQCASFMSSIMNNLLDVRKMEEGKMVLHETPLSLTELVERVRTMLLPSVRPGVKLITHCKLEDHGQDWVLGDSHRIQQVLTNVITNAIKYTSCGSIVVTVTSSSTSSSSSSSCENKSNDKTNNNNNQNIVRFECKDTGPGIPKMDQSKLFQRFVQRGGAPGTGLGLAISKHLVDLKGGRIFFESDPTIQPGTTCIVEMPLESCSGEGLMMMMKSNSTSLENGQEGEEQNGNDDENSSPFIDDAISLLIVDDVRINRRLFRRRVSKGIAPNANITEAATGEEALEKCKQRRFDVILVDQHMEEAGGVLLGTDTVVAMRRRNVDSVIVGCSGNDIDDQFTEAGTDWVMKKPTPPNDVIVKKLKQLLLARRNGQNKNDAPTTSSSDMSNSEDAKRRLGLSVCPSFGPPHPLFKKQRIL
eukprot:scaffold5114_cov67-Cylindrotheca_fusiformis.AAC.7